MYGYIYMTTNTVNNKKYIGKHTSSVFDPTYLGSGKALLRAVKKYGKRYFKNILLEECVSKEHINEREKYWIKYYDAVYSTEYYNISEGGDGASQGELNPSKSLEVRKKISSNNSMKNPLYRKRLSESKMGKALPHTKEWNEKIGNALRGRTTQPLSKETKDKISKANSGEKNGMFGKSAVVGTKWYNNGIKNVRAKECPEGFVPGVYKGGNPGE